jgi:hypothetical protein
MPGIDNWGHMGGLFGGALVTWGLLPRYRPPTVAFPGAYPLEEEPRVCFFPTWVVFCTALFVFGVQTATDIWLGRF